MQWLLQGEGGSNVRSFFEAGETSNTLAWVRIRVLRSAWWVRAETASGMHHSPGVTCSLISRTRRAERARWHVVLFSSNATGFTVATPKMLTTDRDDGRVTTTTESSKNGAIASSRMNFSRHVRLATIFSLILATACCLVAGLGLGRVRIRFSV